MPGCNVDLFASRLTAVFPTYAYWKPDPGASYTDAMSLDSAPLKGCAFPPFSLIAPVLKKVSQDKTDLALVAPVWQAQPWWPVLLNLLMKNQVIIPNSKYSLRDPACPLAQNPSNVSQAPSGGLSHIREQHKTEGFLEDVTEILPQPRVPPHIRHTSQPGGNGTAGVVNGKLIQFQQH